LDVGADGYGVVTQRTAMPADARPAWSTFLSGDECRSRLFVVEVTAPVFPRRFAAANTRSAAPLLTCAVSTVADN
jgi:hypothetical protein